MTFKASALVMGALLLACLRPFSAAQAQTKPGPINIDEAIRDPVKPDRAQAYYHYATGKLREKEGSWDKAEEEMRKALQLDPGNSELIAEVAEFYLRVRKVNEAIDLCKEAIKLNNDNADAHYLLGNIYSFVTGQPEFKVTPEDALREFNEVIRIDPNHTAAQFRLGQLYLRAQKPEKAVEFFQSFNSQTGGNDESYYYLAVAYEAMDRLDEAINAVQSSVQMQPNPRNLELLGNLLTKAGRSKEATDTFRKILGEEGGNNIEVKKRLAATLMGNNEFDEAAQLLEDVVSQDSEDLASLVQLGKAYFGLRKLDKALETFESALKLDPANVGTKFYIAYVHEEKGDTQEALASFRKLLDETYKPAGKYSPQEFEDRVLFQRHMAFIYQDSGELDKAIEEFRGILSMQDKPENYRSLISALRQAHKNAEALQLSAEGLKKNPDDKYLALANSQLVSEVEGFDKAQKLAQALIDKNPKDIDYYVSFSQICLEAKRYTEAEEALKKALEISGGNEMIQFQLGAVYERAKSYEQAEEQFLQIIKKNPRNAGALNYLGYMWADRGVRLDEALEHIKQAVELDPNNGAYLDSLGWVYFKLDRLPEAEQYLGEALRRVKNDATIHEHMGDLYFKRGQFSKAEEAWQQAIANGTEDEEITKIKEKLDHLKKMPRNMN